MRRGSFFCCLRLHQERIDKYVKVAVYDGLYISHLDSGAVILYQSIGLEYVGTYLAAPFYLLHLALYLSHVLKALPLGQLQQLALQYAHSHVLIVELAALVLALYHYAGGEMCDTYCRAYLVDVLAACAAGTVGVYADIVGVDLYLAGVLLEYGSYVQRRK